MEAFQNLKDGNKRYRSGNANHPHQSMARIKDLSSGQNPPVAVLSCADSRVPPEIIFDQGLGDLFALRVAGNVVNDMILGSLEYGVEHLGVGAILVLGHTKCGAVSAACSGGDPGGHIPSLIEAIAPAVSKVDANASDRVDRAVVENVRNMVVVIKTCDPILRGFVDRGELQVAGAVYNLDTGNVEWLD